jgi:hypothetical protein
VPGLPDRARAEGLSPLGFMKQYGAFEVATKVGPVYAQPVPEAELVGVVVDDRGRACTTSPSPIATNIVPVPTPDPDSDGRRAVGIEVDGRVVRGFPTPSGRLEFYSRTLAAWGWPEHAIPGYVKSHVHPQNLASGEMPLIPNFRVPVQIHTRSANAKWLDEIAHTNPLWIHPSDAHRLGIAHTGDLVRVETRIGHFIVKAWITEGIRPGVVACSHHMGRWRTSGHGQRQMMPLVSLDHQDRDWRLTRRGDIEPFESADADTRHIWWTDGGVHQNLAFPVQPDPISGMHCWHQAVRVCRAEPGDRYGDIRVDTAMARLEYEKWLQLTRPAREVSPDGTRRPYWLLRPLKPGREAYRLP